MHRLTTGKYWRKISVAKAGEVHMKGAHFAFQPDCEGQVTRRWQKHAVANKNEIVFYIWNPHTV